MEKQWFVIHTKKSFETSVIMQLHKKNIECFCPLNLKATGWPIYKKENFKPLFPSLLFIKIWEQQFHTILRIDGVINFFYWLSKPAVIKDADVKLLQHFLSEYSINKIEKREVTIDKAAGISIEPFLLEENGSLNIEFNVIKLNLPSLGYTLSALYQSNIATEDIYTTDNVQKEVLKISTAFYQ